MIRAKAYLGPELTSVLTTCDELKAHAHHSRRGVPHESVNMTRMSVAEPRRHKHTVGFSDQFAREITEQRLNPAICEENVAGQINDDYGIRTCFVELAERHLTHRLSLAHRVCKLRVRPWRWLVGRQRGNCQLRSSPLRSTLPVIAAASRNIALNFDGLLSNKNWMQSTLSGLCLTLNYTSIPRSAGNSPTSR